MSLQIGKAIYEILHSDADIETKLKGNIFPLIAGGNTTFPFIIYKRTGIVPAYTKDRFSANDSATVEIIVASDKYNDAVEIADLVRVSLEGKKGIYSKL